MKIQGIAKVKTSITIISTINTTTIHEPQQHHHLQNELEARVGLMGGDSLEEADKSWWERHKSWITIVIFLLIIVATIIVIVFIGFGGLNTT